MHLICCHVIMGHTTVIITAHHYYKNPHLSRLLTPFSPSCNNRDCQAKSPGCYNGDQRVPATQKKLRHARVEPRTCCLTHRFLIISPTHHMWLYIRSLPFVLTRGEPFGPGWYHQPEPNGPLIPVGTLWFQLVVLPGIKELGLLSRSHQPRPKIFGLSWWLGGSNWDKRPLHSSPARLAIGLGTKAFICPRSNGGRDKCEEQMSVL